MGHYLADKIEAAHRLFISNSLTDWLISAIAAAAVWALLWIARRFVASRYKKYSVAKARTPVRLLAYLLGNTKQFLFIAITLDAARAPLVLDYATFSSSRRSRPTPPSRAMPISSSV